MLPRRRLPLVAIVALALAVRLTFLAIDPYPYANSGLAADSAEIARQIDQHGRWFTSNIAASTLLGDVQNQRDRLVDPASVDFRQTDAHPQLQPDILEPVGEAVVLAGIWKVTGSERWLPLQLLTVVLDALVAAVVFAIGMELFGRSRTAYLAAFMYAVFVPIAWLATIPHLDIWAVDFTAVITLLLLKARTAELPPRWLAAAGVAIGLGSYFRPGVLLIAPLLALATLSRSSWRQALRLGAIPTLVAVLLLVPWTIRNAEVFHRFIPLRSGTGQNLWEGLGELHNDFGAQLNDAATQTQVHAVRPDLVYGTPAYDDFLLSWATRAIKNHPGFYAKLVGWRFVSSTALLRNTDWAGSILTPAQTGLGLASYIRHRFKDLLVLMLEPLLFLASAATVIVTRRRFARSHLIAGAIIVATLLPYLFLHVEPRYLLPASFAYLLWTALGLDLLVERGKAAGGRRARSETVEAIR
jgi:4-amino-4-deoxy-L-arabinose transferase-like glycosyltransferase